MGWGEKSAQQTRGKLFCVLFYFQRAILIGFSHFHPFYGEVAAALDAAHVQWPFRYECRIGQ